LRAAIAAAFAVPAAIAGYHVVFAMSQLGMPSLAWREVFACLGAVFIGGTAWTRLAIFAEPRPLETERGRARCTSLGGSFGYARRIVLATCSSIKLEQIGALKEGSSSSSEK